MNDAAQFGSLVPTRARLTEQEVRVAGLTSSALIRARHLLQDASGGGTITTKGGTLNLSSHDVRAALHLMEERFENFLSNLDIALDSQG